MLRFLDFLSVPLALYFAVSWCTPEGYHVWYLGAAILATNLFGYFRGMQAGASL